MIKGLGFFSAVAYLVLSSQLSGVAGTGAFLFLTLLTLSFGLASVACLTAPDDVLQGGMNEVQNGLPLSIEGLSHELQDLALLIRRDGLLALESRRKEVKDDFLRYLLKRVMEGYQKHEVLALLRNRAMRRAELTRSVESYFERVVGAATFIGLGSSLWVMIDSMKANATVANPAIFSQIFMPFLFAFMAQIFVQAQVSKRFEDLKESVKLYFIILEEGISGIQDGVNADLLRDRMKARILAKTTWTE